MAVLLRLTAFSVQLNSRVVSGIPFGHEDKCLVVNSMEGYHRSFSNLANASSGTYDRGFLARLETSFFLESR